MGIDGDGVSPSQSSNTTFQEHTTTLMVGRVTEAHDASPSRSLRSVSVSPSDAGDREEKRAVMEREEYWERIAELAKMTALADAADIETFRSPSKGLDGLSVHNGDHHASTTSPYRASSPSGVLGLRSSPRLPSLSHQRSSPFPSPTSMHSRRSTSPLQHVMMLDEEAPEASTSPRRESSRDLVAASVRPSPVRSPSPHQLSLSQISVQSRTLSQILASPVENADIDLASSASSSPKVSRAASHAVRSSPRRRRTLSPIARKSSPAASESSPSSSSSSSSELDPEPEPEPEPEPAGRGRRQRTLAQLNPYSIEQARYTRALLKNGWQGAVVAGPKKGDEMTSEDMKRLKEQRSRIAKDDLGGWLEFEDGRRIRNGQQGDERGGRWVQSDDSRDSEEGEDLLEREARRRKRMEKEINRAMGMNGKTSISYDHQQSSNRRENGELRVAIQPRQAATTAPVAKRRPRKALRDDPSIKRARRDKTRSERDAESDGDSTGASSASSESAAAPSRTDKEPKKKRRRAQLPKDVHVKSDQRARKRSALDAQLLDIEISSSGSDPSGQDQGSGSDEDSEDADGSASSSSPRRPPLAPTVDKTKLKGKRKKALGMMMPAVFMKKAQADLVAMEKEKREGLTSGSDFGSGDDEVLSSSSHEATKGVAKIRRVPMLDEGGRMTFKGDAFTDESGEDDNVPQIDSEEEGEDDAVHSWLHAFAPRRRVNDDEDIVDKFLKRAKKTTTGQRKKAEWNRGQAGPTGKANDRRPLQDKGNRQRPDQPIVKSSKKTQIRSGREATTARSSKASGRPRIKTVLLDTDDAIFSYARADVGGGRTESDSDLSEAIPSRNQNFRSTLTTHGHHSASNLPVTTGTTNAPRPDENEQWASFSKFTPDFAIERLPSGLSLSKLSFVRRGHLTSLLHHREHLDTDTESISSDALGVHLDSCMSCEEIEAMLPQLCDAVFEAASQGEEDDMVQCGDMLHHFGRLISFQSSVSASLIASLEAQLERLDRRIDLVSNLAAIPKNFDDRRLILTWYRFDLSLRIESTVEKVHALALNLIDRLVKKGVERTMKSLRSHMNSPIDDISLHIWLGLVHVGLSADEQNAGPWRENDLWDLVQKRVLDQLSPRATQGLVAGEILSYTAMVLCAISQFSSAGVTTSAPRLHACWTVMLRALEPIDAVALAKSDHSLSNTAIARRDRYIWTLFARSLIFINRWIWQVNAREDIVSRLFDLVGARQLADLSIETQGDFASFLEDPTDFESPQSLVLHLKNDTAFIVLLKLVMNVAKHSELKQLTRLFFRLTPITSQAWTRSSPQLAQSHSVLINHYSLLITFARLAPSSAAQRLDQARRLIDFALVDEDARRTCIRAILYFAFVFRLNTIKLDPVVDWLRTIAQQLRKEYGELEKKRRLEARGVGWKDANSTRPSGTDPLWHRAVLLTMVLRSVQLVLKLKRTEEAGEKIFPDPLLLNSAWTSSLLESPLALDPMIGLEVVKTVSCFLDFRHAAIPRSIGANHHGEGTGEGVSQDEFGMFDEMDFEDPALNAMLGVEGGAAQPEDEQAIFRAKDKALSQFIQNEVSPAFFRLVSNIFGLTEWRGPTVGDRVAYAQHVVETWIRCVTVMVQNDLTDWSGYLRYGNHSWKRVIDPIGRREIGLLLAIHILRNDSEAYVVFQDDLLDIWFQAIVAHSMSSQHTLTNLLLNAENPSPLFEEAQALLDRNGDLKIDLDEHAVDEHRLAIMTSTFRCAARHLLSSANVDPLYSNRQAAALSRTTILNFLRAMLASVKDNLAAIMNERSRASYASFVRKLLDSLRTCGASADINEQTLVDWKGLEKAIGASVA